MRLGGGWKAREREEVGSEKPDLPPSFLIPPPGVSAPAPELIPQIRSPGPQLLPLQGLMAQGGKVNSYFNY